MSKARIYARNLVANWIGHGANLVVLFFLAPWMVDELGKAQYGIWGLLTALTGYMGVADVGIRASVGRHIILYLGKGDQEKLDQTIRTGLGFFSALGAVLLAIGALLGWVFPAAFDTAPKEYHNLLKLLLPLMAGSLWITAYATIYSSVLTAHDRFDLARGVDLIVLAVRTIGTIIVLSLGYGILGLTLVVIACSLVGLLANWSLAKWVHTGLKCWPPMLARERLRELFGYGIPAFISSVAGRLIGQTDLVVVAAVISTDDVTPYSVGAMLVYYTISFIARIQRTFFPPVQRAIARGEMGPARWLFRRQVQLGLLCGVPAYVGFIIFGGVFIRCWMLGPEFTEEMVQQSALVMAILAASRLALLPALGSEGMLAALGHVRQNAAIGIGEALLNLGLSLLFVLGFGWGLPGVAGGTLAAAIVVRMLILPWYTCRKAGMNPLRFLLGIVGIGTVAGGLFAGWCLLVRRTLPAADNWGMFALQVAVALVGFVPIALFVIVPKADRGRALRKLGLVRSPLSSDETTTGSEDE
jgi:O-antigen/teichoic acid export membrane protein